jgi:hypothetical protein
MLLLAFPDKATAKMDKTEAAKLWVEHWQRVAPLLEKVRHDELRAMTDEEARRAFESLAELACEVNDPRARSTSGFVEQQRLFLKLLTDGPAN